MSRWLVELVGEPSDLEEFPLWFPDGDLCAIAESGKTYITGPALDAFDEASQVRDAVLAAVDCFSAIIALLGPSFRRPSVGLVYKESDDGQRQGFCLLTASGEIRVKGRAILSVSGEPPPNRVPTQAQQLLEATRRADTHLGMAMSLWADPVRTWPRLYRILEEVEHSLGKKVNEAEFCSTSRRTRFTRSANSAEIAGKDSRHALGRYDPPRDPMSLQDASSFIGQLLEVALRRLVL